MHHFNPILPGFHRYLSSESPQNNFRYLHVVYTVYSKRLQPGSSLIPRVIRSVPEPIQVSRELEGPNLITT